MHYALHNVELFFRIWSVRNAIPWPIFDQKDKRWNLSGDEIHPLESMVVALVLKKTVSRYSTVNYFIFLKDPLIDHDGRRNVLARCNVNHCLTSNLSAALAASSSADLAAAPPPTVVTPIEGAEPLVPLAVATESGPRVWCTFRNFLSVTFMVMVSGKVVVYLHQQSRHSR